ncbi:peptide/nickel transport system ATP-binding protein [Streptacidiphilus sp. MAP12-16]|uniref:dipeptide ABC transporter ATP-binding protein n=1 Tax=Streptacidiphilus sp. MAP12-16 TaxID=3156300 RepID=UPI0035140609
MSRTGTAVEPSSTQDPAEQTLLQVRGLHVDFTGVPAVRGVDLDVRRGEVLGVVGESGSGKSVTAMAVLGLLPATARARGSVRLGGTELLGRPRAELAKIRGRRIAMVFQDPLSALTPVYRIGDQIAEALLVHQDIGRAAARDRAVELLDLVGIPDPRTRADAFPHEYSGGMRQRAVIAMAIANNPEVILADEPTTALDVTVQAQVLEVLRTAQRETGAALVLVSHDLGVIAGMADRVAVMYAGRVVETAPVDELYARPRMPYTLGLLGAVPRLEADCVRAPLVPVPGTPPAMAALGPGCPFAPRCPLAADECRTTEPELLGREGHLAACHRTALVVGRAPAEVFPVSGLPLPAQAPAPRSERDPVLAVERLVKTFPLLKGGVFARRVGSVYAVDGLDLDIRTGETLALVGESGSGKSTALFEILRMGRPEGGRIELFGQDSGTFGRARAQRVRGEVQIVFQDPMSALDPRMPIGEIVAEPLRAQGAARSRIAARVPEVLRQVGLDPADATRFPHQFSGGQRQRIGIARALATEPRLLVLDEPVSALDVSVQAGVLNLLQRLKAELGLAYLFVSHDLSVVRQIADRVSVLYLGRTLESGPADELFERPLHPYTQALLSAVPLPDPVRERARERIMLAGDPPSPTERHTGCRFRPRCPLYAALDPDSAPAQRCASQEPQPTPAGDRMVACHHVQPGPDLQHPPSGTSR